MSFFDMSLTQLEIYNPPRQEPQDFDEFWAATLADARQHDLSAEFVPHNAGLGLLDVYDVSFAGFGGQTVKGWYMRPTNVDTPLPCIMQFIGYGGGRGYPHDWLFWPAAGYACFVMDTRGQGSAWQVGDTPDHGMGANPAYPGFMTQGILDQETYYYRRVYTDAVRAVEAVRSRTDVDAARIALTGESQGGGITIAAAGLVPDVALCMPDVPFLCHFQRAVGLTAERPYEEIVRFLKIHRDQEARVFKTLAYFDGIHFAPRIQAQALFSTSLMDAICPPSTVFAAYNAMTVPKAIEVYRFNGHEGGGTRHQLKQLALVNNLWRN